MNVIGLNLDFLSEFNITEIIIPEGITSINSNVFSNNTFITLVDIPSTISTMPSGLFSGCSALESISIPFVGAQQNASANLSLFGYIFGTSNYAGSTEVTQTYWSDPNSSYYSINYYIPSNLKNVEIKK